MKRRLAGLSGIFILLTSAVYAQSGFTRTRHPQSVIFDTDFGPDYDDVGAITLLHGFADSGYIRILATMASSRHKNVAAAISVFNDYFRRPGIPIGVVQGPSVTLGDKQHWTDTVISRYPHHIPNNEAADDALILYRKILAAQPDHSVTIITVGFFTNLANLLASQKDDYSELTGRELVERKVTGLVSMAGRFPSGFEFNLMQDTAASRKVLSFWPTPILFSGFEIGQKIKTGLPLMKDHEIRNSPVKDVFSLCIPLAAEDSAGRMSWDETAVLVAVKGWKPYYDQQTGSCRINADGSDEWILPEGKQRARLVEKIPPAVMSQIINQMLMR